MAERSTGRSTGNSFGAPTMSAMLHVACMHSLCLPRLVLVPWLDLTGGGGQGGQRDLDRVDTLTHLTLSLMALLPLPQSPLCSSADIVVDQR